VNIAYDVKTYVTIAHASGPVLEVAVDAVLVQRETEFCQKSADRKWWMVL
jgi:hypothetical protein